VAGINFGCREQADFNQAALRQPLTPLVLRKALENGL
jgi:hypothetical protein